MWSYKFILLQCWRQLSKLQKLILYLLTSIILILLLIWFIGTTKNLEILSEINSLELTQQTISPQDIIVNVVMLLLWKTNKLLIIYLIYLFSFYRN